MKKSCAVLTLAILPILLSSAIGGRVFGQQVSPSEAVALAKKGEYATAAANLERAVSAGAMTPAVVEALYYSWVRQGEYLKARDRFEAWAKANPNAPAIRLAAGRIDHIVGKSADSLNHLNAIQNSADVGLAARIEKAAVLIDTGKRAEADAIYKQIVADYQKGILNKKSDLRYVARALWATNAFFDANETYKQIKRLDPMNAEAMVDWGDLLAYSTSPDLAVESYEDALAVDPNMPEALIGMASNLAEDEKDSPGKALERVFEVNPNSIEGNLMTASQQLDEEQYDRALKTVDKIFAINPQSTDALSIVAVVHYVRGETEEYNKTVQKVMQIDPEPGNMYYTLATSCVSLRHYKEAVDFARKAVQLNPTDWQSMSVLGVNLLRIGQEDEGVATLDKIYMGNPFDRPTVNTLTLTDSWKNFDRIATEHFRLKLNKKESGALEPYVTDLLEKAYKTLSAKYEFTPEGPIGFEMYPDHEDFAVRTLGVPGLGALGVCFGKLVVMDSPAARKQDEFNWGSTLWHEFTHVITLQMTDHKIPRWFSEGLSVYEERKAYPGWGDDMKLQFLQSIKSSDPKRKFLPIAELNNGFIHQAYPGQVLVSYYESSLVADYIESKWGFPAIRKMLLLYKAGKTTPDVFKEGLNVTLDGFDVEFMKWVEAKAAGINPEQYHKQYELGVKSLEAGDEDTAIKTLGDAVNMYPEYSDDDNAYEPLAQAYIKKGDKANAIATLKKFLNYSETSYLSYVKLSSMLEETGDIAGAAKAMEGAMYVRPLELSGHEKLGALALKLKQYKEAEREYQVLLGLNTPDRAGAYFHLAESNLGQGNKADAYKNVMESLKIAPTYQPAQSLLLQVR